MQYLGLSGEETDLALLRELGTKLLGMIKIHRKQAEVPSIPPQYGLPSRAVSRIDQRRWIV